ncbi:hypothetical protein [Anaerocolumna xylanovorans]|uniref:SdpI/YhfL protein family protein n=1 Tax=Anaerocolumna xylanovorans DSM 12503 TaxID=1121345 RepID=A0A1M7Y136_9FIRM|nr:hypothetical protein [Anaerocolumna xylanovorans]SHO45168.1 hypothetical protein SAMN02745217_00851 [Anaerocolumna xylanovorans DSM 12503]
MLIAIVCWLAAILFIIMGFLASRSKKPAGIYSNIKAPNKDKITDIRAYNKAVGWLLTGYGLLQAAAGVLLLIFQVSDKKAGNLLVFPFFFGAIFMMIIYEAVIAEKYIKKTGETHEKQRRSN